MHTTTLTIDGREVRVIHSTDWSGIAYVQSDTSHSIAGWIARALCREETLPERADASAARLLEIERSMLKAVAGERDKAQARAEQAEATIAKAWSILTGCWAAPTAGLPPGQPSHFGRPRS